jgi:dethiobiotin synthetase
MPALSIAGAGTDIGKTHVAVALIHALRRRGVSVDALKPVASGYTDDTAAESDPGRLLQALGLPLTTETLDRICPLRFAAPLSPPLAARLEGRRIDYNAVLHFCRKRTVARQVLLVETAGGVMSPLDDDHTMLDLMADLGAPVVLVAGSYLGAISHALTALSVLRHAGLSVCAIALSESEGVHPQLEETQRALQHFGGSVPVVPFLRKAPPDAAADVLAVHSANL